MSYRTTSEGLIFVLLSTFTCCTETGVEAKARKNKIIVPLAEYTKEQPAEWAGQENDHLPTIKLTDGEARGNVVAHGVLSAREFG
jgi:hypothetical protein